MRSENYGNRSLFTALCLIFIIVFMSLSVSAGVVEIGKGKEVKLKFPAGIQITSGNVTPGIPIVCYLAEPIIEGGVVVVEEGAQATASVVSAEPAKKGGKPGKIKLEFISLDPKGEYKLVTEPKIKLGGTIEKEGKGKKFLSYLFIFGLFIKGGQGSIATDMIYTVKVAESVYLEN